MAYSEKYELLTRGEIAQLQIERLQSTLNRVYRNVAFYRQQFDSNGVNIERIKSLEALSELPFTTREDLGKSYPYEMFAVPLREIVRVHAIPGAAGAPTVIGYTRNDLRSWTDYTARLLNAAGVTPNDVVQIALPYSLSAGGFGFHQGAEHLGASVIPCSATASADKQVTIMKDFKTTVLICNPSYALKLGEAMREAQHHPGHLNLRIGIFGGEPWGEDYRAQLEEQLHIIALDTYGISEVVGPGAAGECLDRKGLHVNEDHFIMEVIDPKTLRPVKEGERGELVFTTITREGFPVIRYRTGDLASATTEPCSCGRAFQRITRISERLDDRIFFAGVGIFPSQIEAILTEVVGALPHYEIILDRKNGTESLEIKMEVSEKILALDEIRNLETLRHLIARRIESVLDVPATVGFLEPRSVKDLPTKGKVIDRRSAKG